MHLFGWEVTFRRAADRDVEYRLRVVLEQERANVLAALNRADLAFHAGNLDRARAEVSLALLALTDPSRSPFKASQSYGGTE